MILFVALCLLVVELCIICKQQFENTLPVVAAAAVLVCYGLAMFQALAWFEWVVLATDAAGLGWCAVQVVLGRGRKLLGEGLRNIVTPGLLCFALVAALFVAAALPHRVSHTDEVYVWAIQPLSIYYHQGFVGALLNLSVRFMTYTPGMHLFQWIGLAIHGEWSEGVVFLWLWLFYAIMLLPLTRRLTWKKAGWMPVYAVAIILLPAVFNAEAYRILRVDAALGLAVGYATVMAWRFATEAENRSFNGIATALALALLVLVKQPGIGWAIFPVAIALLAGKRVRGLKANIKEAAVLFALPLLTFLSWNLFCALAGLTGQHIETLQSNLTNIVSRQYSVSGGDLLALLNALVISVTQGSASIAGGVLTVPQIAWPLIFITFAIVLHRYGQLDRQTTRRLIALLAVCYVAYTGAFYAALLVVFRPEWTSPVDLAKMVPFMDNMQRYGCGIWYALLMLLSYIGTAPRAATVPEPPQAARKNQWPARGLALLLAVVALVGIQWDVIIANLVLGRYEPGTLAEEMDGIQANSFWAEEIEDPNAVVLLASDNYPNNRLWLQYALAPLKLVMPYQTGLSAVDFEALLRDEQINYFVSEGTENELYQLASAYAPDKMLDEYTMYAIKWQGDDLSLVALGE